MGEARIVPDERSNSLIVFASKKDMEMITNIVAKVDVLLAQVLIEGIVLSVALDNTQDTGVSWLQNPKRFNDKLSGAGGINAGAPFLSSVTNFAGGLPSGFSYFGNIGNDFEVAIKAIATRRAPGFAAAPPANVSCCSRQLFQRFDRAPT